MKNLPEIRCFEGAAPRKPSDVIEEAAKTWITANCYLQSGPDHNQLAYARTLATMAYLDKLQELGKL